MGSPGCQGLDSYSYHKVCRGLPGPSWDSDWQFLLIDVVPDLGKCCSSQLHQQIYTISLYFSALQKWYETDPLVNVYIYLYGTSPIFDGSINDSWPCSIAFCKFTRGEKNSPQDRPVDLELRPVSRQSESMVDCQWLVQNRLHAPPRQI